LEETNLEETNGRDRSGRDFTFVQKYGGKFEIKRILVRPRPTRSFKEEGTSYGFDAPECG
jgi:hypothetical protein